MTTTRDDPSDSPISLRRFNIRSTPVRVTQTYFGKIRALNTFTALEWVYLVSSLIALTTSMGLTIERIAVEKANTNDFTFAILLLLTIAFCYHYVIHAIFTERADELMVFVISNTIVLVYCILNFIKGSRPTIKLVRLIVVCSCSPFLIAVGLIQSYRYCNSNNLIYNTVGGLHSLQKACKMFFLCSSLLKFDLQLQLSMLILVMGNGIEAMSLTQKVILGSGVPATVIFILIGFLGLRKENKTLMVIFYILGLFEPGYIVYKFYYTGTYENDSATYDSTFACGCFALVIWVSLMISTGYFVTFHFGKGLKQKMFEDQEEPQPSRTESGVTVQSEATETTATITVGASKTSAAIDEAEDMEI